ncbi:MAG TPA: class I SAM-dependent methyltransferase [Candidatus Sulfomarinibacteraceae bacterium]|nr:class I SAM-dependent methyltransferase [Candidatus Sulfomarinibacteraceae bacterium]
MQHTMMDVGKQQADRSAVIRNELEWHEQEAQRRDALDRFLYDPPAFDEVVQPAIAFLQARDGERVLDIGCGEGKETLELVSRGLCVISVDLSHRQLCRARERVQEATGTATVHFVQASAEALPFAANQFPIIYGKAILHHLDFDYFFAEMDRITTPESRATFAEPMAHHPLFWLFRRLTPRLRTSDERPAILTDMENFARRFTRYQVRTFFLLAPLAYVFRLTPATEGLFRKAHALLQKIDRGLFRRARFLQRFAWYSLILLERRR